MAQDRDNKPIKIAEAEAARIALYNPLFDCEAYRQ